MKVHYQSFLLYLAISAVLCLTSGSVTSASSAGKSNLDSWLGQYRFVEAPAELSTWKHSITIYKDSREYYAHITVDGRQTQMHLQAKVEGDNGAIHLIFDKYLPENMFESYTPGQFLLSLRINGSTVFTEWGALKPLGTERQDAGVYFEKFVDQKGSIANGNRPEENGGAFSWFSFDSMFLGGAVSGKWLTAEELFENKQYNSRIQNGQSCDVYSPNGLMRKAAIARLYSENAWNNIQRFDAQLENGTTLSPGSTRLAVSCHWNPVPRQPVIMATNNATYATVVQNYLAQNNLPNVKPNIVQIIKVDLEGDGVDEVIICAQNIVARDTKSFTWEQGKPLVASGIGFPSGSVKGNYSLLLLRKIINGQVREIPLGKFIALKNATPADNEQISPPLYKVYQFADLNGDGIMEIIIGEDYYESISYSIYEVKKDKVTKVLTNGIGS